MPGTVSVVFLNNLSNLVLNIKIAHWIFGAGEGALKLVLLTKNDLFIMPINVSKDSKHQMAENTQTGKYYRNKDKRIEEEDFSFESPNSED